MNPLIEIAFITDSEPPVAIIDLLCSRYKVSVFNSGFSLINDEKNLKKYKAIISTSDYTSINGLSLFSEIRYHNIPFIFIVGTFPNPALSRNLLFMGVADVLTYSQDSEVILHKIEYHINLKRQRNVEKANNKYSMPLGKRIFDFVFSLLLLISLAPVFIIIAILVKLESRGPVFYTSKRVGTGYTVFNFYKFRTMYADADKRLGQLAALNQYKSKSGNSIPPLMKTCQECDLTMKSCDSMLYLDGSVVCEKLLLAHKFEDSESAFIKITNDPRVTRLGLFLRNTSLDELPQIFNVLKGDMSFVGNRPLPLYEAEKLTTDRFTPRFVAPAGITGLWQVSKRGGKGVMSHEERIELDNQYARDFSFKGDLKIIFKTVPAMFQRENV